MKEFVYYEVYAERHEYYGRTHFGYFKHKKNAEKCLEECKKKYVKKGSFLDDGYYENDWDIEEHIIELKDLK